jgi:hypothetical protein
MGKRANPSYRLLGDDIVVVGRPAAEGYEKLFKLLEIPISQPKTLRSRVGFEFCKRRYRDGREVTPLPMKVCLHENRDYAAYEMFRHLCKFLQPAELFNLVDRLDREQTSYRISAIT